MKKEIPLPAMIAIIAVVVIIAGLIGWQVLNPGAPHVDAKSAMVKKNAKDGGD